MKAFNRCKGTAKRGQLVATALAALLLIIQVQTVYAGTDPYDIRSGKDVELVFHGPTSVDRGVPTSGFVTTLTNLDQEPVEDNVRIRFEVTGSDAVAEGDVFIELETVPGSGAFIPVPMTQCYSNLCGEFGPESGFPMGPNYTVMTEFRVTFNQSGDFTLRANVYGVTSTNEYASASINESVRSANVSMTIAGSGSTDLGVPTSGLSTTVQNTGDGAIRELVYFGFEISGQAPLGKGTVIGEIESPPGSGQYAEIPFVVCGLNLCGEFGAAGGFEVAAGYAAVRAMRLTFEKTDVYVVNANLLGAKSGTDYASDLVTMEVVNLPSKMSIAAGQSQSAPVDAAVATMPEIRVEDADGNPVAGINVTFSVPSGGGHVAHASMVSGADGLVSPGTWMLGSAPGTNELLVEVPGYDVQPQTLFAKAFRQSEVSVEMSSNANRVTFGGTQEHVIVVSNHGPSTATSTEVSVQMPVGYAEDSIQWSCFGANGAQCPATGSGSIHEILDLPVGASAMFVVSGTVISGDGNSESITLNAEVFQADDATLRNNFASTRTDLILSRGSFEAGERGAGNAGAAVEHLGSLDGQNFLKRKLPVVVNSVMQTIAQGYSDRGTRFAIDQVLVGDTRVLLLSSSSFGQPTEWATAIVPPSTTYIAIGLEQNPRSLAPPRLIVVGDDVSLDVSIAVDHQVEVSGVKIW